MRISETVKVGPFTYTVKFCDILRSNDGQDCYGWTVYHEQHICLWTGAPRQTQETAFIHECLHVIDEVYCLGLEEKQIAVLAPVLLELFRENGLLKDEDAESERW